MDASDITPAYQLQTLLILIDAIKGYMQKNPDMFIGIKLNITVMSKEKIISDYLNSAFEANTIITRTNIADDLLSNIEHFGAKALRNFGITGVGPV